MFVPNPKNVSYLISGRECKISSCDVSYHIYNTHVTSGFCIYDAVKNSFWKVRRKHGTSEPVLN